MSALGIYFGPEMISIVETKGKKIINNIQIPQKAITASELEEKVPEDIKMVAFFKDEMRRNNIIANEVNLALSGKDLIIRTFEVPVMPREDLPRAITFEARKYMPFKVEELILEHQVCYDKAARKNLVLLIGIKKETLDKYISIFRQLNLKIISLEYAAFGVLRLLKLAGLSDKGIVGVIDADIVELDEFNFMVLENGFPLFSRDIILRGGPEGFLKGEEDMASGMILEKLKTEMRVSLDYYHRKFPAKNIDKIFLVSSRDYQSDLEAFTKDIGLDIRFVDVEKAIGKPIAFSLSFLKGYSSALAKEIKIAPRIDLLLAKIKQTKEAVPSSELEVPMFKDMIFKGLRMEPAILITALLVCAAAFSFGIYQKLPLHKEISSIKGSRTQVAGVNLEAAYEELVNLDSEYKRKLDALDKVIQKQLYVTAPLSVIAKVMPPGVWLTSFSFNKKEGEKAELSLQGMAYLADSDKEFEAINKFLSGLKENAEFNKYFKEINITSVYRGQLKQLSVTNFSIACKAY
ncbi:MAG: pilus assembly protein PilM [Candidatus Omnitrophota bacterium]|nr:pilus assembly protein PilM [Candidatus Omnitrophota bacterium]